MRDKDIPEAVQMCLQEYNIDSSHVDLLKIAHGAGIKVIKDSDVHELRPGMYGVTYHNYETGQSIIIYDDSLSLEQRRFTIAHEIGHVYLKHHEEHAELLRHIEQLKERSGRRAERQADKFAEILLKKKSPIQTAPTKVTSV